MATIERRTNRQEPFDQEPPTGTPLLLSTVGAASRDLRRRWVTSTTVGAAAAWALPVGVYLLAPDLSQWKPAAVLLLAAMVGGAGLAGLQACVLRRRLGSFVIREWILATAAAAVLEWAVILLAIVFGAEVAASPVFTQVPVVASGMLAMAFALGIGQWLVLRRWSDQAVLWIWANAVAWIVGAAVFVALAQPLSISGSPTTTFVIVVAVLGALLRGAVTAPITGTYLVPVLAPEHLRLGVRCSSRSATREPAGSASHTHGCSTVIARALAPLARVIAGFRSRARPAVTGVRGGRYEAGMTDAAAAPECAPAADSRVLLAPARDVVEE
ncbi:hypothetical protein AB0M34_26930 [Nocardia sp. NPDC050193]